MSYPCIQHLAKIGELQLLFCDITTYVYAIVAKHELIGLELCLILLLRSPLLSSLWSLPYTSLESLKCDQGI